MKKIVQHSPIEGNYFESSYDDALQAMRRELKKEEDRGKQAMRRELKKEEDRGKREKSGPIGYIAGEGSIGLERDGMRGEILTRMVTSFERMLFVLEEWSSFRAWVITSPLDDKIDEEKSKKLLQLVKSQIDNGGKVITVWPAVNERNSSKWKGLFELWKTLDEALSRLDYGNRIFTTARSIFAHGKLYIEAGSKKKDIGSLITAVSGFHIRIIEVDALEGRACVARR
ncbi:hypothetical protein OESDEN_09174 [Oesophagostomum dentatum]|uniref:Uncharacterized protein n=1 Tax=Oesophagostomum dentatum TaxID=61180 RepID=A0A0B1T6E1_OESDE|nr:hypothetical protein OESDEN_09174 [Oesophagostomum dentatum]